MFGKFYNDVYVVNNGVGMGYNHAISLWNQVAYGIFPSDLCLIICEGGWRGAGLFWHFMALQLIGARPNFLFFSLIGWWLYCWEKLVEVMKATYRCFFDLSTHLQAMNRQEKRNEESVCSHFSTMHLSGKTRQCDQQRCKIFFIFMYWQGRSHERYSYNRSRTICRNN